MVLSDFSFFLCFRFRKKWKFVDFFECWQKCELLKIRNRNICDRRGYELYPCKIQDAISIFDPRFKTTKLIALFKKKRFWKLPVTIAKVMKYFVFLGRTAPEKCEFFVKKKLFGDSVFLELTSGIIKFEWCHGVKDACHRYLHSN